MVRETSWYVVGLLSRGQDGDDARAAEVLDCVLSHQFDAPGRVHHGTWRRRPGEPEPPSDAVVWRDYDPNWREFIGCTLLLVLREFESRLPARLAERIEHALRLASEGSLGRAVEPHYTNIALMGAYLLDGAGRRLGMPALRQAGEDLALRVHSLWAETSAFCEFNSPTYYGVDLFALALWRRSAPSAALRRLGGVMEEALWREIAERYHPALRNLAGPYDRTYGMDIQRYTALTGLWIRLATGAGTSPLPAGDPAESAHSHSHAHSHAHSHSHDWCFAPCFALLDPQPPADTVARLTAFSGPRHVITLVSRSPRRVATTWLGERHTIGAMDSGTTMKDAGDMCCPVAVHWLARGGEHDVNWLRAAPSTAVDGVVDEDGTLLLTHHRTAESAPLCFEVQAPPVAAAEVAANRWRLPGMSVRIRSDEAVNVRTERSGDLLRIAYAPKGSGPATGQGLRLLLQFTAG